VKKVQTFWWFVRMWWPIKRWGTFAIMYPRGQHSLSFQGQVFWGVSGTRQTS